MRPSGGQGLCCGAPSAGPRYVLAPMQEMIDLWMAEGVLRDPYDEFFVYQRPSSVAALWQERYILDHGMVRGTRDLSRGSLRVCTV